MKLALIPARGGSKRIPQKNIRLFAGKPMISYAIDVARRCGVFDAVVVSTDDDEIARIAVQHGAEVPFMRPPELADDHATTLAVVGHGITAMQARGRKVDLACCIYPGVPLLQPEDLVSALDLLVRGGSAYSFPVVAHPSPVQRALRRYPDGRTEPLYPQFTQTRTQDLEPAYYDAGQFYWGRADAWTGGLDIHRHACTLVVPEWRAVDIDTPDDWTSAELLFRAVRGAADPGPP